MFHSMACRTRLEKLVRDAEATEVNTQEVEAPSSGSTAPETHRVTERPATEDATKCLHAHHIGRSNPNVNRDVWLKFSI